MKSINESEEWWSMLVPEGWFVNTTRTFLGNFLAKRKIGLIYLVQELDFR